MDFLRINRCCHNTRAAQAKPSSVQEDEPSNKAIGDDAGEGPAVARGGSSSGTSVVTPSGGPPLSLSGPQWTGPLHDREELEAMRQEAEARGWLGHDFVIDSPYAGSRGPSSATNTDQGAIDGVVPGTVMDNVAKEPRAKKPSLARTKKSAPLPLGDLLGVLIDEADARLPPGFIAVDRVGRHLASNPGRDKLIAALRAGGFAASRCHLDPRALRTNARMVDILRACQDSLGIRVRPDSPFATVVVLCGVT